MRKRLKRKLRSCGLCKPHKVGGTQRWKRRDLVLLTLAERDCREAAKRHDCHCDCPADGREKDQS